MKLKSKIFSVIFLWLLILGTAMAQEEVKTNESSWSIGSDLVSRYVWRGINLGGSSPSIQPYIEYGFGNEDHAFSIGAWGAYSLSGSQTGQEADLYLSYTFKDLITLSLTDYFFPDETVDRNNFFNYNMDWAKINSGETDQTGHVMEAALSFNGTDKIPISLLFAMNIWGADSRNFKEENGNYVAEDGIVFSKYIELGYSAALNGIDLDVFIGATLDNPDTENGEPAGFYGQDSAGLINLGFTLSKEIKVTESYSIPISASLISNPETENIFIVFGISF